ncbi:hypothetical protein SAMN04515671_0468 [Nakamurella panacisegetis]|uniref:Ig-like domain (Group 3) n=1 Tax=Nakamurella panacisegetis TaxID=1090615 RepID=A0A1H0IDX5_9ACTN|nr:hypothetical protein [Nakamurella panacisegetis]SDO29624.1 hypothetical protein SAMN04515671_0468 [Nakamurella panacisegetis]
MTPAEHVATSFRRRFAAALSARVAAALAAVATLAVGLLIGLNPSAQAAASPTAAVAAPSTTSSGSATLTVDPASGLSATGGTIKVSGKGFKITDGLYVAICHADGKAPASLADCVGGAIPNSNTSLSWAHITVDGTGGTAGSGPVVAQWAPGGVFSVSLTLPASNSASDALDCSRVVCAVYTVVDSGNDASQSLSVPLTYAVASTSTSPTLTPTTATTTSTTTTPSTTSQPIVTSTLVGAPTTVQPKTIRSTSIRAGGQQEVLFAGFKKDEPVALSLDSTKLPAVRADADGIVDAKFTVPTSTAPGTHILRAIGQKSNVIGIATFAVTAIPTNSKPATTAIASSTTAASSAPASSAIVAVPTVSSAPVSSAPQSTAPATTSAAAVVPVTNTGSSKPVWPWYVLGLVILLWIGFAVYMLRRRRSRLADEMREKDRLLAEGAAAEQNRSAGAVAAANSDAPTAYIGPPPAGEPGGYGGYNPGEHGLLAGRDNPDNPGLLSGQRYRTDSTGDLPTSNLGQGVPLNPAPDQPGGPPTGAWTPDFTSGPAAAAPGSTPAPDAEDADPGTAQWSPPFFDNPEDDDSGGRHSR